MSRPARQQKPATRRNYVPEKKINFGTPVFCFDHLLQPNLTELLQNYAEKKGGKVR